MTVLWPNGSSTRPNVSSKFGPRSAPVAGASRVHRGTDFTGFHYVRAIAAGRVVAVGAPGGWAGGGTQVWIQHDGFFTRSMHMRAGSRQVHVGQQIDVGQIIGVMGMTGTASGVHLHLEITYGNVHYSNTGQVDPVPFITDRLGSFAGGETAPTPAPVPEEDDEMKIIRWAANGACWLMTDESTDYIETTPHLAALEKIYGGAKTVENDELTAIVSSLKVPWQAMESTFRSQAFDNESRFGKGTSWTRTMAEAQRQTQFDTALAKSIDDLEKAIGDAKTAAG